MGISERLMPQGCTCGVTNLEQPLGLEEGGRPLGAAKKTSSLKPFLGSSLG